MTASSPLSRISYRATASGDASGSGGVHRSTGTTTTTHAYDGIRTSLAEPGYRVSVKGDSFCKVTQSRPWSRSESSTVWLGLARKLRYCRAVFAKEPKLDSSSSASIASPSESLSRNLSTRPASTTSRSMPTNLASNVSELCRVSIPRALPDAAAGSEALIREPSPSGSNGRLPGRNVHSSTPSPKFSLTSVEVPAAKSRIRLGMGHSGWIGNGRASLILRPGKTRSLMGIRISR
mmetsp:Transcript_18668/g.70624  ORF Transcript_18668/g.70624 Transcript_18668/m.70624 type:complete len:235 (-) Transcript_18668:189-893(-)